MSTSAAGGASHCSVSAAEKDLPFPDPPDPVFAFSDIFSILSYFIWYFTTTNHSWYWNLSNAKIVDKNFMIKTLTFLQDGEDNNENASQCMLFSNWIIVSRHSDMHCTSVLEIYLRTRSFNASFSWTNSKYWLFLKFAFSTFA